MGFLGDLLGGGSSSSTSTSSSKQKGSSSVNFAGPGNDILGTLSNRFLAGGATLPSNVQGFYNQTLAQQPGTNPYFNDQVNSLTQQAERSGANLLANMRSQMVGAPEGRTQFALNAGAEQMASTLQNNLLGLLSGQYNQDIQNQFNAAQGLTQGQQSENQTGLNLLQLLQGRDWTQESNSTGTQTTDSSMGLMDGLFRGGLALSGLGGFF